MIHILSSLKFHFRCEPMGEQMKKEVKEKSDKENDMMSWCATISSFLVNNIEERDGWVYHTCLEFC